MKRFVLGLMIGILIAGAGMVYAGQNIRLFINNREIVTEVPPQLVNGCMMVPAREVAEALGATVSWDMSKNAIVITGGNGGNSGIQTGPANVGPKSSNPVYLFTDLKPFNMTELRIEPEEVSIGGEKVTGYCPVKFRYQSLNFKLSGKYHTLILYTGAVDGEAFGGELVISANGKDIKPIGLIPPAEGLKKFEMDVTGVDILSIRSYASAWTNPSYIVNASVQ